MTIDTTPARSLLLSEINLEGFTPDEKKEIIDLLVENIVIKINNDIFTLLEGQDRVEFILLSQTAHNKEIGIFLKEKIADLDGLVRRAAQYIIRDFKNTT